VEPPRVERRLEPDGSGPVSGGHGDSEAVGVTSVRSRVGQAGGHDEALRGSCGEAAGEELGAHPVKRRSKPSCTDGPARMLLAGLTTCSSDAQAYQDNNAGAPQGGILSPLLASIASSVLDEHVTAAWAAMGDANARHRRGRRGEATYRPIRYADDFVILVHGTRAHAEALRDQAAAVLAPMGLRLSPAKTKICHIEEGFDFLGFRSSGSRNEAAGNRPSTPTRPRKQCTRSPARCARSPDRDSTCLWPSYSTGSRRSCGAGPPYFKHGVQRRPPTTCTASPGVGCSYGSAANTAVRTGSGSDGTTCPGGGPRTETWHCSTRKVTVSRYRYRANIASPWSAARLSPDTSA
jgi:RNA-directed DNA polymerase